MQDARPAVDETGASVPWRSPCQETDAPSSSRRKPEQTTHAGGRTCVTVTLVDASVSDMPSWIVSKWSSIAPALTTEKVGRTVYGCKCSMNCSRSSFICGSRYPQGDVESLAT